VSGFVKFDLSAQRAVAAKERTAAAIANGFILSNGGFISSPTMRPKEIEY